MNVTIKVVLDNSCPFFFSLSTENKNVMSASKMLELALAGKLNTNPDIPYLRKLAEEEETARQEAERPKRRCTLCKERKESKRWQHHPLQHLPSRKKDKVAKKGLFCAQCAFKLRINGTERHLLYLMLPPEERKYLLKNKWKSVDVKIDQLRKDRKK